MEWHASSNMLAIHPKLRKFMRMTGLSTIQAVGGLNCFWAFVGSNHPDGLVDGMSDEDIALAFDPDALIDPERVVKALYECRFIVDGRVNDWIEHNPLRKRALQKQEARETKKRQEETRTDSRRLSQTVVSDRTGQDKTGQNQSIELRVENGKAHDALSFDQWFASVFWEAYPRKRGKAAAHAKLKRLFRGLSDAEESALSDSIMDALEFLIDHDWRGKDPEFIPHASTWIHQRRWEDIRHAQAQN